MVKRVNPEVLTNRDEWEVIGLKDGDEVVGATDLATGTETLCFITSDAQLLHFGADGVRPAGPRGRRHGRRPPGGRRAGASGSAPSTPPPATVPSSSPPRAPPPPCPAPSPAPSRSRRSREYPGKGRATGGVRCHRFLKGEDTLVLAWAGTAPARAAAASGAPVELPEATGRRDGSGTPGSQPIAACAGPVASALAVLTGVRG